MNSEQYRDELRLFRSGFISLLGTALGSVGLYQFLYGGGDLWKFFQSLLLLGGVLNAYFFVREIHKPDRPVERCPHCNRVMP